ncbi:MAG: histidine kinase, partial [Phycisphaerales bacterium]|nr:histidine kinase [Phycisphaerales bacterium]
DELTFSQVRDHIPNILRQLALALESNGPGQTEQLVAITAEHGITRYDQTFSLAELMVEYTLLRVTLFQKCAAQLGRPLTGHETDALIVGLDIAARRSVLAFVDHQSHELQTATEAQSKYLSFLSHDLRGGLNGVFLMIEVLKRELANEPRLTETVEDLDIMRRSLLETVGTMDRFLHAERFRKGKVQVRPAKVNLGHMLKETAAHFSYQAKEKGLKVSVDVPGDCNVVSDRELLTLIFQNVMSNALKYTGKGGEVAVATKNEPKGCLVSVRDTGPGIAPEKLNELFAPFARGETYGQPGVGLGLSIARQAAEYLQSKLWAESQPGKGSTFFLEIPAEIEAKSSK